MSRIASAGFRFASHACSLSLSTTLCFVVCVLALQAAAFSAEPAFVVSGYLPDYRVNLVKPSAVRLLDELILFSIELKSDGSLDESRWTERHWQAIAPLREAKHLRNLICVGGWERSAGFADICQSPSLRLKAAAELVRYCQKYKLSGVNLDWEHPSTPAEQQAFATWLGELHPIFDRNALDLSIAVAASQKLPPAAWAAAHRVMLMSYDDAGKHSSFAASQKHLALMLEQGVKPSQLVLCVPFYGRHEDTRDPLTYADIVQKFSPRPDQDEVNGIHFNGPGTIAAKTQWARTLGLAGVAAWELGQDAPGEQSLLRTVRRVSQ